MRMKLPDKKWNLILWLMITNVIWKNSSMIWMKAKTLFSEILKTGC